MTALENTGMDTAAVRSLTPPGAQMFFGYYDVPPVTADGRHLCHRVAFRDRLPEPGDVVELGTVSLDDAHDFVPFARTTAWNFQQGAMLQRLGTSGDRVIYNTRDAADPARAVAVVHDRATGAKRLLPRPVANVSRDGRWALSVSFARLFAFRPGYGYAGLEEPTFTEAQPSDDGVWVMDIETGTQKLIISLATLGERLKDVAPYFRGRLLINHLTFNPSASRIVLLVRNFPEPGGKGWQTAVLTIGRDGSGLRLIGPATFASHYWWSDDKTLLFWCDGPEGNRHYRITDEAKPVFTAIDPGFFLADGHMSTSPDGRWLVYDSYPDKERNQHLWIYDQQTRRGVEVGRYAALAVPVIDIRCDLHPRWMPDGRRISFDSTHEGHRALYLADVGELMESLGTTK